MIYKNLFRTAEIYCIRKKYKIISPEDFSVKINSVLELLPVHTEVSVAWVMNNETGYFGVRKDEKQISGLDNRASAFEIGSVTKALTGRVLSQMMSDGKVSLEDPYGNDRTIMLGGRSITGTAN